MKIATTILIVIAVTALAAIGGLKVVDGEVWVGIASILIAVANAILLS